LLGKLNIVRKIKSRSLAILLACFVFSTKAQQIANYVNNGGFEVPKASNLQKAKYWDSIDSIKYGTILLSQTITPFLVPQSSFTYQWPFKGKNYLLSSLLFKPNTLQTLRGYPRNYLKQSLQSGKTYCVKFYCNITNQSSFAVDGLGAYFGDVNIDTITQCNKPISYLAPQVQYMAGFMTDTMNWVPVTGTFVANGTEKYLLLGNFKSDLTTSTLMINPTNSVLVFSDVLYDNVSCIDIDLPAYAGPDLWCIPGDSVFIGRQPDVGIDEACMWYQMPNTTTPIDTVAGLWVKPNTTTSYMVRQEICGNVKWDLVTVNQSATGLVRSNIIANSLKLFPQPTSDELNLTFEMEGPYEFSTLKVYNSLGELVKEEAIKFVDGKAQLKTSDLTNGIYTLQLSFLDTALVPLATRNDGWQITKKFVIAR